MMKQVASISHPFRDFQTLSSDLCGSNSQKIPIIVYNNKIQIRYPSKMSQQGSIEVIYGPMFSGKSSELLRKVRRYQHAKKKCMIINYKHDDRYDTGNLMSTHDRQKKQAFKVQNLMTLKQEARKHDVIAIDQGQFFRDILEFCEEFANQGKIVIVAALDGTFQRKPFGNIINLLPLAQKISKLTAVCVYCTKEASFTLRTIDSEDIEVIGGQQSYKPVCRQCYWKYSPKKVRNIEESQKEEKKVTEIQEQ